MTVLCDPSKVKRLKDDINQLATCDFNKDKEKIENLLDSSLSELVELKKIFGVKSIDMSIDRASLNHELITEPYFDSQMEKIINLVNCLVERIEQYSEKELFAIHQEIRQIDSKILKLNFFLRNKNKENELAA